MSKRLKPYVAAVLLVVAATALGKTLFLKLAPTNQVMLYLLAVVISGLGWGRESTVLASVLGVAAFDFFFVPPVFLLSVADAEYLITFTAFLVVALAIGNLTGRLRDHATMLAARERETAALYAFSQRMVAARDLPEVGSAVAVHVSDTIGCPVALLLPSGETFASPGFAARSSGERIPLATPQGEVGTLVLGTGAELDGAQKRLLEILAAQAAVVVERAMLAEATRRAQLLLEEERLHDALLHSISHSLRTPLSSIIGSLSTLLDPGPGELSPAVRHDLVEAAREEAERLNGLVGNLLDMTRLETGHLRLLVDWYDLEDVIGAALGQAERTLKGRQVRVDLPEGLPLVALDQVLIMQVLENLLDNAVKYSLPNSPLEIGVRRVRSAVEISVADQGPGIPEAERERVFAKFYRVERPGSPSGTGLGLAICKGIVEAHHGRIWAEERPGGGTVIRFTLPRRAKGRDADVPDSPGG
jgi:two-component system, OmpR family, sensor histidine kinase KdpD